jgi:hypothetical protein
VAGPVAGICAQTKSAVEPNMETPSTTAIIRRAIGDFMSNVPSIRRSEGPSADQTDEGPDRLRE